MEELRRYEYGDPAKVAEMREQRKCNGCRHKTMLWGMWYCEKGRWAGTLNERRCELYGEVR
jgi:hypothetical protein